MNTCKDCKFCHFMPIEVLVPQPKKHWWSFSYSTYEMSRTEKDYYCYAKNNGRLETSLDRPACRFFQGEETNGK